MRFYIIKYYYVLCFALVTLFCRLYQDHTTESHIYQILWGYGWVVCGDILFALLGLQVQQWYLKAGKYQEEWNQLNMYVRTVISATVYIALCECAYYPFACW